MSEQNNLPPTEWIRSLPTAAKESIRQMSSLREVKDQIEEDLKAVNKQYDYLRFVHIPKCMEDEGIENMRITGIGMCYLSPVVRARINPERKTDAYEWLEDNGHGDIVTETVNAQTLSSVVKQLLAKNETVPADLITVDALTQANIRSK
jgi:hypothetical protein